MRYPLQENMIPVLWIIFALYWVLAAARQKRSNQHESLFTRLFNMVLAAIAFLFLLYYKDSIEVLWILLGLYVALTILRIRSAKQSQSLLTRLPHIAAMIVAFTLLLERRAHFGSLERRFLPNSQTGIWIGIGVTACGMGLAIWARYHLGANWSATITIRTNHSLVCTGPYARLRHPIYSGLLIAIAVPRWRKANGADCWLWRLPSSFGRSRQGRRNLGCETSSALNSKNTPNVLGSFCQG